jgi:N-glycosylase/DNA lyase
MMVQALSGLVVDECFDGRIRMSNLCLLYECSKRGEDVCSEVLLTFPGQTGKKIIHNYNVYVTNIEFENFKIRYRKHCHAVSEALTAYEIFLKFPHAGTAETYNKAAKDEGVKKALLLDPKLFIRAGTYNLAQMEATRRRGYK